MAVTRGAPPLLDGFTYVERVGEGGFADVFLYRDALNRHVAVKVLLDSAVEGMQRDLFDAEANVMAQLSDHPSIVSIYQAGVSGDGRPYLVMEYCPAPNLAVRYRSESLSVPDVLEIGIRVSSAVETAHRAGILHRDIKPHNILVSAYGAPLLTDFGIAATTHGDGSSEATGVSVPWSPPEAFWDEPPADVRSDVFSLGATLYTLLAGRSPFEVSGGANDNATLMTRIERQALTRINRADVPDVLWAAIERSMSKDLADRQPSALVFAEQLQEVQGSLGIAATRIEVLDASGVVEDAPQVQEDSRTRVRPVAIIVPDALPPIGTRLRPVVVEQPDDRTAVRRGAAPAVPDTMARVPAGAVDAGTDRGASVLEPAPVAPSEEAALPQSGSRMRIVLTGVVSLLLVSAVAIGLLLAGGDEPGADPLDSGLAQEPAVVVPNTTPPPSPIELTGRAEADAAVFRWVNPDPQEGDTYRWFSRDEDGRHGPRDVDDTTVSVPYGPNGSVCIEVLTRRGTQTSPAEQAPAACVSRP